MGCFRIQRGIQGCGCRFSRSVTRQLLNGSFQVLFPCSYFHRSHYAIMPDYGVLHNTEFPLVLVLVLILDDDDISLSTLQGDKALCLRLCRSCRPSRYSLVHLCHIAPLHFCRYLAHFLSGMSSS